MASSNGKATKGQIILLILLIVLVLGLSGFLIVRSRKSEVEMPNPIIEDRKKSSGGSPKNDNFPLRNGSYGPKVRQLQEALIKKFGVSILPKYGVDGDFGDETEAALISKFQVSKVDASIFDRIIKDSNVSSSTASTVIDYKGIAAKLKTAFDGFGTNNSVVIDLLNPSRNKVYLKSVRNTYDAAYGGTGTLVKTLEDEQEGTEFSEIINILKIV
jgi:hypothetical protein